MDLLAGLKWVVGFYVVMLLGAGATAALLLRWVLS